MPTVPPAGASPGPGAGAPYGAAGVAAGGNARLDQPWYRRPGTVAAVVVGALVVIGLLVALFFLLFAGDDDEDSTVNVLRIERVDAQGDPLVVELTGTVTGAGGSESWLWLSPPNSFAPEPAVGTTDGSGRLEFEWGPTDDVVEPETWRSTIVVSEALAPETELSAFAFNCELERSGQSNTVVELAVELVPPADETQPVVANYAFPNFEFVAGDVVRCTVSDGVGPPPTSSTTVVETTTTVPESTTTTTVPETTTTTSTTTTTTTTTTVPGTTAMDVLEGRADLSGFVDLIDFAGLRDEFSDPTARLTVFAPDDDAIDALVNDPSAPDLSDPDVVEEIVLTHVNTTDVLSSTTLLSLSEVTVENGGPHPIDDTVTPPTVGGAGLIEVDVTASNGVIHLLDAVLEP
jgi:uncharacterized surface protein with fasciclin (FAS1) repeats